ncbi:MAG TPA: PDZ domain-containing protein [Acidobacteriota bacterium]|nr:PDZ domain-containing protein [Acidobacteriota bacterium]
MRLVHFRALAAFLTLAVCSSAPLVRAQNEFQGLIAESADQNFRNALVSVQLVDSHAGVMYGDRYVSEVKVEQESSMTGAVIDSQGHVLVVLDEFTLHDKKLEGIKAWIDTAEDGKIEASVVGADLRLDLLLLHCARLGDASLPLGRTLKADRLHFVARRGEDWAVRTPHYIRIQPIQRLPEWELEVNATNEAAFGGQLKGTYILDGEGELAGIVTRQKRYFRRMGQDEPIAVYYALPSETLRDSLRRMEKEKLVSGGWLGVDLRESRDRGVFVTKVWPATPAEQGGVEVDDVIREVDGWKPANLLELGAYIRWTPPGKTIALLVKRASADRLLRIKLGERYQPSIWAIQVPNQWEGQEASPEKLRLERRPLILPLDLGLELEALNKFWAAKLGFPGKTGVMVSNLVEGAAAEKYFQVGDIITEVNGQPVCCLEELRKVLAAATDSKLHLKFFRDGKYESLTIQRRR